MIVLSWLGAIGCAGTPVPPEPAPEVRRPVSVEVSEPVRRPSSADVVERARSDGVWIAGLLVHDGPRDTLSPTQRAYLTRLERVLEAYARAPDPPVTYAQDPGRWMRWSQDTLPAAFAGLDGETERLVREHPRTLNESEAERRFHVLLALIEAEHAAHFYARMSGGPPGYPGCPHDPPSQLAALLTELVRLAGACVTSTAADPVWADTRAECARRGAWARSLLAQATPPAPDECMEQMPSPRD